MALNQILSSPNRRTELRRQATPLILGLTIAAGMGLTGLALSLVLFR